MPNPNLNPIPEGFGRVIGRLLHYNSEAGVTVPLPFAEVSFWPSTRRKIIGQQSGIPFPLFTGAPIMASSDENGYIIGPDERFGVDLIASDGPTDPTGFTWSVRVNAPGSTPRVWSIWVPEGETTDLFKTEPIPPNLGQQIIRWEEVRRQVYAARDETFEARDETLLARDETLAASVGVDDKVTQAGVYADLSEEFALRSEAAALRSEGFSGDSERSAQDSQNAAGISQNWADRAEEEADRSKAEANRAETSANQSAVSAEEAAELVAGALHAVEDAEGFANQARGYRDEADGYAGDSQASAEAALSSAASASTQAQSSAASASNASIAAAAAQNSAINSAASEVSAGVSATNAAASASTSQTAASAAAQSAGNSLTYSENSQISATASQGSATASEASRVASEAARGAASTAASQAQAAQTGAETAEQNAMLSAEEAESSATAAGLSATSAEISATEAEASAASMLTQGRLTFDEETGRYTNASIRGFLSARSTPRPYGVLVPKGLATICTKTGANAGITNPIPGIIGTPAVDPYTSHSPFFTLEVNGGVEVDGTPFVTAVKGDANFKRDGSNGDVWILAPVLFWRFGEVVEEEEMKLEVSDTPLAGFDIQPKGLLPSGEQRPYMLYAKYGLSLVNGVAHSISGHPLAIRNVSHNSLITQCKNATTGYSGKSFADDWYTKIMILLKYATKNSQSVFAGVTSFAITDFVTIAETDTTRIIIPNAAASNLPIGSGISLGTNDPVSADRANTATFNIFDMRTILKKEAYDEANQAVYVSGASFSTAVGYRVTSMPWSPGGCDGVIGDGSPTNPLSQREPFVIQGIEMGLGAYESLGDVILANTGDGWRPRLLHDSKLAATSVTADYTDPGVGPDTTDGTWQYPLYPENAGGLLFGKSAGGSTSTGMADGSNINPLATIGIRQWLALGLLTIGGLAGFWLVFGALALSSTAWPLSSRLSAIGRSEENTPQ